MIPQRAATALADGATGTQRIKSKKFKAKNFKVFNFSTVNFPLRTFFLVPLWLCTSIVIAAIQLVASAHSGPPFPILSDQIAGAYRISIWADPDATDDGSAAGQFWVMLQPARADAGPPIPAGTRVEVAIRPLDRPDAVQSGRAAPVNADAARQFVALLMDHEGPFGVRVTVDGPLGTADVQASANATYDLRPQPVLLVLFVLPFVLVGFVWGKLLIRRRMQRPGGR
jgi:hypothetical protein